MRYAWFLILGLVQNAYSFSWQDLWMTRDQQAQRLMEQGEFRQAEERFQEPDWQAAAAYRAGEYDKSAQILSSLKGQQNYYNQGNALAHLKRYKEAIKAYDAALHLNPNNKDAEYNRKLVADLLENQQKNEKNTEQGKSNQSDQPSQSSQQNQNQSSQSQDKSQDSQNSQEQNQQSDSNKADSALSEENQKQREKQKEKSQTNHSNNEKESDEMNDQPNNDKPEQAQEAEKAQQEQAKEQETNQQKSQENQSKNKDSRPGTEQSTAEREKQQARDQWLRLIPDEPGGLLREKLLRDYLRRQHHELQP